MGAIRTTRLPRTISFLALASVVAGGCSRTNQGTADMTPQIIADDDLAGIEPGDASAPPDLAPPPDLFACPAAPFADPHVNERTTCKYLAGARVDETLAVTPAMRQQIHLEHIIIITEENRSFDHFFGRLPAFGQPDVDVWPASFSNPDNNGAAVAPYHLTSAALPLDPPHQSAAMNAGWNNGAMNGFVKSAATGGGDGHFAMGYYDGSDLPFLYWLAKNYSLADHYFAPVLGGTWSNRDYLYAATSDGIHDTGERVLDKPTIYDALDKAHITWGVYANGTPRQDCMGWTSSHAGVHNIAAFRSALAGGSLPAVSFVDPAGCEDTHPTADIHGGEQWLRSLYTAAVASPAWATTAMIITFDEAGGLADHAAPPEACPPSADQSTFNRYGVRVPTIVVSPWARRGYVSHAVHDHTSLLRLIEAVYDLPALTARDANADALFDMFDFSCAAVAAPASPPAAGGAGMCL
jgi:phospholipase C